jgi:hypothetical protein
MVKNLMKRTSSRENHFSKILFTVSRCRITEDDGSGDLLSRLQMHVDERDEVASAAQEQNQRNLDALVFFVVVHVATAMVAIRIYRKDPPSVTASRNRLGLSLSKRIRHGLIAKLNGKRRL